MLTAEVPRVLEAMGPELASKVANIPVELVFMAEQDGLWQPETRIIRISSVIGAEGLSLILLHEYGHALGLVHSPDPHNIMHPNLRYLQIDLAEAVAQIKRSMHLTSH